MENFNTIPIEKLPDGATLTDPSGIKATSIEDRRVFVGAYLTTYQALEYEEHIGHFNTTSLNIVFSPSWPDFTQIAQDTYCYEFSDGTRIDVFEIGLWNKPLSCGSPATLQIVYEGKEFFFCDSVSRKDKPADLSVCIAKIKKPDTEFIGVNDTHLRKALKDIELCYNI